MFGGKAILRHDRGYSGAFGDARDQVTVASRTAEEMPATVEIQKYPCLVRSGGNNPLAGEAPRRRANFATDGERDIRIHRFEPGALLLNRGQHVAERGDGLAPLR